MEQSDILRNLRIEQLTPMQEAARDAYQSDKDLVLLSPTGSGKTLAFLLPLVQSLKADVQGRTGGGASYPSRAELALADRKRIQVDERPFSRR
ncbi:MAG: DEAD/DEAH box helicase [Bacteroides stercoris]